MAGITAEISYRDISFLLPKSSTFTVRSTSVLVPAIEIGISTYEGKTQMEVSAEVGISQAQVSRLEKGAINTIRKHL